MLLNKIESMLNNFTTSERKVAKYILEKESYFTYSLSEFSDIVGVSQPTIIRFSRTIGLKGYSDLKLRLSVINSIKKRETIASSSIELHKDDNPSEIFESLSTYTIKSINSTLYNTLDSNILEKITDLIWETSKTNKKIFLTGMGMSSLIAESLQIKLMRINIGSIFYSDMHLRFEACTNLAVDDILICFTALGKSKENYDLIHLAKNNGAKVILITQCGASKLEDVVDYTIYTTAIENNLRLTTQASFIVQYLITDTIFLSLALKDYDTFYSSIQEAKENFYKYGYYKK